MGRLGVAAASPILNIGSSTLDFRTREQPWIEQQLIEPLRQAGGRIINIDIKAAPGVDLTADISRPEDLERVAALGGRSAMLCNLLEHVEDPAALLQCALRTVPVGGHLVITVPRSYPYHRDPIDTLFRPTPDEVAALAPNATMVDAAVLDTGYYWGKLKTRPWLILRPILRFPFPMFGWTRWKRSMGKLYWLFRPYQHTAVVLRRDS